MRRLSEIKIENSLRKVSDNNIISIIPEYGRQKLLGYAESFKELAKLFEEDDGIGEFSGDIQSRQEYIWQKKLYESKELLAEHLKEMSYIMSDVAHETYKYHLLGERKYRQISRYLKESGILLKDFFVLEKEDGHMELCLTMKTQVRESIIIDDVADLLSVVMNIRMRSSKREPLFMAKEWTAYRFIEEPKFHILTGFAKAVKEKERISGDNYSFCEIESGRVAAILSDGMGSGEEACEESGRVIEMMEKLLEAGFRKEAAVQIINGALAAGEQKKNMSTLDVCELNLYTGICELVKVGAACSYIKRDDIVDRLSSGNLPLGIFQQIKPDVMNRQLQDGDYVIMLSDGILDAFSQAGQEELVPEIISRIYHNNPSEIANQILGYCLRQSMGRIQDDMTVLVIGIWKYS